MFLALGRERLRHLFFQNVQNLRLDMVGPSSVFVQTVAILYFQPKLERSLKSQVDAVIAVKTAFQIVLQSRSFCNFPVNFPAGNQLRGNSDDGCAR